MGYPMVVDDFCFFFDRFTSRSPLQSVQISFSTDCSDVACHGQKCLVDRLL